MIKLKAGTALLFSLMAIHSQSTNRVQASEMLKTVQTIAKRNTIDIWAYGDGDGIVVRRTPSEYRAYIVVVHLSIQPAFKEGDKVVVIGKMIPDDKSAIIPVGASPVLTRLQEEYYLDVKEIEQGFPSPEKAKAAINRVIDKKHAVHELTDEQSRRFPAVCVTGIRR